MSDSNNFSPETMEVLDTASDCMGETTLAVLNEAANGLFPDDEEARNKLIGSSIVELVRQYMLQSDDVTFTEYLGQVVTITALQLALRQ